MRTLAISKKVIKELFRDKRTLAMLFIAPIVIMLLLNAMFSATTNVKLNLSTINVSQEIVETITNTHNVSVQSFDSAEQTFDALKNEEIDAVIEFDDNQHYNITYANTDSNKTLMTKQVFQSSLAALGNEQLQKELAKNVPELTEAFQHNEAPTINEYYQYGDADTGFFSRIIPILLGFFVFFFVFLISGMGLLKERTSGTLDRLLATPVKRSEIVYGYMLSYGIIATIQTIVIVFSSIYLLKIEVAGAIFNVIIVNIVLSMVALAFGILLSTLAKSEFQMMQFIPLIVMPQMFFSGIIPLDGMAEWVQVIGKVLPISYAGDALSNIILHGKGLSDISYDLFILFVFIIVLTFLNIIGLKRYRKV